MTPVAMAQVVETALDVIGSIVRTANHAETAITAIKAIVQALHEGGEGRIAPHVILSEIESLRDSIASNDQAALAELRDRFAK